MWPKVVGGLSRTDPVLFPWKGGLYCLSPKKVWGVTTYMKIAGPIYFNIIPRATPKFRLTFTHVLAPASRPGLVCLASIIAVQNSTNRP